MFLFALGSSHDAGYSISKVTDTEFFVVIDTEEINRFQNFARLSMKSRQVETNIMANQFPREEWNALRDFLIEQKKCNSKGTSGNCYVKINNSLYQIAL